MALKTEVHTFNIRITDTTKGWMWYAGLIGSTFKAKNFTTEAFMLADDSRIVWKTDCEIVK
jgi:hypothetical protein